MTRGPSTWSRARVRVICRKLEASLWNAGGTLPYVRSKCNASALSYISPPRWVSSGDRVGAGLWLAVRALLAKLPGQRVLQLRLQPHTSSQHRDLLVSHPAVEKATEGVLRSSQDLLYSLLAVSK